MGLKHFKYCTFINMVLSFCGLFLYRVIVKQTFQYYFAEKVTKLSRTIIYGTDANAISCFKAGISARFKIVAFIDRNGQNSSKRMLDLPILILKKNFLL
jgi:FlaA1/EpsC-like NDP-sugar epimerase